ncbi:MAG: substrate-binding domain-containing protein [Pseudomonadota bacterium]
MVISFTDGSLFECDDNNHTLAPRCRWRRLSTPSGQIISCLRNNWLRHWGFVKKNESPDAIIGGNDSLAIAAMHAMLTRGLSIPDDSLIAGFNGLETANVAYFSLTTIVSPLKEMGCEAGRLAIERLETGIFPTHKKVFPVTLRRGGST